MNYFTIDKPYNSLNQYYKNKFNKKVAKIALNSNFTCPNRDGTKGVGGCIFCSNAGSGDLAGDKNKALKDQFNDISKIMLNKWPDSSFIPYLQSFSNTYKDINELKKIYDECINLSDNIVGFDIATRADCINEDIAKLLNDYNKKIPITVELGLQTSNEETAKKINRCLTNLEFENAVKILRKYNIEIVVHIINGLPGEDINDMLNTIKYINKLDIQGIKFHSLLVLKNTKLYDEYLKEKFHILSLEEYVKITSLQISYLKDDIIIHRLAADGIINDLIEPKWTIKKLVVMNEIDKYLRNNNLYQGIYYKKDE